MNKKQVKTSGVFKEILESNTKKSKVEQFLNEPIVSEEFLENELAKYEEEHFNGNLEEYEEDIITETRLEGVRSYKQAVSLYKEVYQKIYEDLEILAALEIHIMQNRAIANYNENSTKYALFKTAKKDYTYIIGRTKFYDINSETNDTRTSGGGSLESLNIKSLDEFLANKEYVKQAQIKAITWMYEHSNGGMISRLEELEKFIKNKKS